MNNDSDIIGKKNEDYRSILATANKLEALQSNLESVIDFFLTPIVKLYNKLCNDCMKLLFEGDFKLDHFRRAEELVWRRLYHDIYRFQKTKRQRVKKQDECLIEAHFISGIGFYSSLIIRLRSHYKIHDVPGVIAPLNLTLGPIDNFVHNQLLNEDDESHKFPDVSLHATSTDDDCSVCVDQDLQDGSQGNKARDWAKQAIYRSLVYMGDLARYLLETNQFDYRKLAFDFYRSASMNQPEYGLPFNQLATLASGLNYNLDAVCNYMRCCLRPKPFEGAEGNMQKLFDLNTKFYDQIRENDVMKYSAVLASKEPTIAAETLMKSLISIFIKLSSDIWTAASVHQNEKLNIEINAETQRFFETLREALELEPIVPLASPLSIHEQEFCPISGGSSCLEKPKYVSPTIIYEFCSISIMIIAKCQRHQTSSKLNTTEPIVSYVSNLANTLALNLLHYSTSKCQKMIVNKVQELRMNRQDVSMIDKKGQPQCRTVNMDYRNSGGNLSISSSQKSSDNLNPSSEATSRRALSRLRQRKAASNYSDNNILQRPILHQEDSDMSELEETALSTIDALEISSEMSETDCQANDLIDLGSSGSSDELPFINEQHPHLFGGRVNQPSKPALRPTKSQNYELERCLNIADSSNSLPVPDLLTGDFDQKAINNNMKASGVSQNWSDSPSESANRQNLTDQEASRICSNETSELESAYAHIYKYTYLPTTKILCDWLLSNGDIISSNLQSFRAFCVELDELVKLLDELKRMVDMNNSTSVDAKSEVANMELTSFDSSFGQLESESLVFKHAYDGPAWIQKYPLSCDFPLYNSSPLENVHELNIDFRYPTELSDPESGFITIQCVVAFYHALKAFLENKNIQ